MTDFNLHHSAPIRAYFAQADDGENHIAAWIGGIWFTVLIWIVGQFIISIPMVIGILLVDPDFMQKMPTPESSGSGGILMGLVFVLSSIMAIILYSIRPKNDPVYDRNLVIAAMVMVAISSVCITYMLMSGDSEANAFFMSYLGKSAFIYGSMLLSFPIIAVGVFLAQRAIHKRSIRALLTAAEAFRWGRLAFSMIVFWVIAGALTWFGHQSGTQAVEWVFEPNRYWGFFFVSLLLIPLQSATEEIVLRGYFNQGLSRIIKSPWIIFFITSAGFAALHLGNPEVAQGDVEGHKWLTLSSYFFFGMFACLLTYIDGGLETAIGVHAANNLYAATFLGYEFSALPTPTVFRTGFSGDKEALSTIILLGLVCLVMYVTRKPALRAVKSINTGL